MKRKLRFVFVIAMTIAISTLVVRGTEEQEETFGDKLKKLFVRPTPTPKPRKKRRAPPTPTVAATLPASETSTSSPSGTPLPSITPLSSVSATATAQSSEAPAAATSAAETVTPTRAAEGRTQYFEAVRPINPGPRSRRSPSPKIIATPKSTPIPETTATATPIETVVETPTPTETPVSRPVPSLPPVMKSSPATSPIPKKTPTPTATISLPEISDSKSYSPEVKKVIDLGLNLTAQNLGYKINSADPRGRGMDSSGFVYYVLSQGGMKGVPRDAREQYIWVRKAGNFRAVLAQRDDTFELDELKPGDLLFWASSYGFSRDPDISQTMIYLGREKGTNQRIMIGAGERLVYKGLSRSGVNVFDFKVERPKSKSNGEPGPVFVGYGRAPGVSGK